MPTLTLHFENARQAQQLFDHHSGNLRLLQEELDVIATARDGWIKLDGSNENLERARQVFAALQQLHETGQRTGKPELLQAIRTVKEEGVAALKSLGEERIFTTARKPSVLPKTVGQKAYVQAIQTHDLTIAAGPAGTGKTYLAMAMAVNALSQGHVSRIILTRPAVEAGEALGFLPGDLKEKLSPYLRPLHDALMDMIPAEEIERHMERETIEIAPLAYMRGRTLNQAFVILDEAQNTTGEQMLMFLTRLGYNTRAVVTGDPTQVDLPPQKQSGLIEAMRLLKDIEGLALVTLNHKDIVRHPLVQRIIRAYETDRHGSK